jgi:predicted dienelactone hydrolase
MPLFPLGRRLFRRSLPVALLTTGFAASGAVSLALVVAVPARALERVELLLPLLDTSFSINLAEMASDRSPMAGDSDLAQLDQALDGVISRKLREVFLQPLPVQNQRMANQVAHSAMLNQALLAASALGQVQGFPAQTDPGTELALVVQRASAKGELSLLALLQAIPGESVTVDLDRALALLRRLKTQQQLAAQLITSSTPVAVNPKQAATGPLQLRRSTRSIVVPHRSEALELVIYSPDGQSGPQAQQRQLVVISHGLWDGPENFEGWARLLASHGYMVVLPRHPGSDASQQRAMLSGQVPPPSPEELMLRPKDVSAMADAMAADGQLVVIGHSWGATTALQLAGASPSANQLRERCGLLDDPARNLSWVLQCSFMSSADRSGLGDQRVIAVVAVSPPLNLLFDHGASRSMHARTLLVSGSRDWVVPPDVEAIEPFGRSAPAGHQLLLVGGGDHFNLRAPAPGTGGPLAPVMLAWVQAAFAAGPQARPAEGAPPLLPPSGWGNSTMPLVEVKRSAASP